MTTGQKTVTVFVTLISALLTTIVGLSQGWPMWAWLAAAAVHCAAPPLVFAGAGRRQDPFPPGSLLEPDLPVPPVERRELRIQEVAMPSNARDYDFLFSATVRWCPLDASMDSPAVHASGLAVEAVLERVRVITEKRSPSRASLVQHELGGVLATLQPDASGLVQAMALDVTLTLSDEDQRRLDKLAAVRKDEEVWAHERRYEQSRRTYLGEDVLKDTGSAVVWWLHKNDDSVSKTVQDLGLLAQLASASKNEQVAEPFRHLVPGVPGLDAPAPAGRAAQGPAGGDRDPVQLFVEFLATAGLKPGDNASVFLADMAATTLEDVDDELASALRERFDPLGDCAGPDETDPGSDPGEDPGAGQPF
ncbi:hypothetical protein ACFPM3_08380 [Streptomyces coeruleoprunus]|uniref:Uncharacterized protein n=1 Tax=Streptomyces coeruleoprunus TaxID=285563 RepID=A0ABV9XDW5_9ACTN